MVHSDCKHGSEDKMCKNKVSINHAHLLFSPRDHSSTSPKNLPTSPYIFSKIRPCIFLFHTGKCGHSSL